MSTMTTVRKTLEFTQSEDFVDALSAESYHLAAETSPPEYVKKVSRYLAEQRTQGQVSNDPAEAESDSGDSLFITQKPVPEAKRSRRRQQSYSQRSLPASITRLEEEDSSSSSSSSFPTHGESSTVKKRSGMRAKNCKLPRHSFPFLSQRRPRRALLTVRHNASLHYHVMGGFLKCVRELQQGGERGDDLSSSLPTVDVEGGSISPLSEDEEEGSESVDIKVVERKRFVFTPSKTKRSQPQKAAETRGSSVKRHEREARVKGQGQKASQGRQKRKQHQIPPKPLISTSPRSLAQSENSDDGGPSRSIVAERDTRNKHVTRGRSIRARSEAPTTERRLTRGNKKNIQRKESEKPLCDDSDATYCQTLELQGSPRLQDTVMDRETSLNVTEPPADVFITDLSQMEQPEDEPESKSLPQSLPEPVSGTDNESVCNETRVKKKRGGDDERWGRSQEDPGGLQAARSVEVDAGDTPSPAEDNPAEPPAMQTRDKPESLSPDDVVARQEERRTPDSKHAKKRRQNGAGGVGMEEDANMEARVETESQSSLTRNVVNGDEGKKKKKKGKRGVEDVEHLKASVVSEPLKDDGEILTKKKKRKKAKIVDMEEQVLNISSEQPVSSGRQSEETGGCLIDIESTRERLEKKRKKHKKKWPSADQDDTGFGAKDDAGLSSCNDATTEESSVKKKKKKKKRESTVEGVDISCTFDENQKVDDADHSQETKEGSDNRDAESGIKKKKKKKKGSTPEDVDVYCCPDKNKKVDDADHSQTMMEGSDHRDAESGTKKKKKKKREILSRAASEDTVAQSDDLVSVRKKKRTSSFLVADVGGKDAQTHEEQSFPCSNSTAAPVCGAGKPGVSAGAPETESAEMAGNVAESNNGARKKKRKRKVEESVCSEQVFEEPNETRESSLPHATETRVKEKKEIEEK